MALYVGANEIGELGVPSLVVSEHDQLGAEGDRSVGLPSSRPELEDGKHLCLCIGRPAHDGERRSAPCGRKPRVEGLPQLTRETLDLGEGALCATDIARLEEGARAMNCRIPCDLAAAQLTRQRGQLGDELRALGKGERVVDG